MTTSRTAPPHLPPSLTIHMLFFLLSATISDGFHENTTTVPGCPSFTCGDINITYPFWVSRDQPDPPPYYCGYPELMLRCGNDAPILNLDGGDYAVTFIDYSAHTLNLSILQEPSRSDCPTPRRNLTSGSLGSSLLTYTASDSNLTFFFNCSDASPENPITCLESGGNRSYVFPDDAIPPGYNWATECQEAVVAPVLHAAVVETMYSLYLKFGAILRRGFQLHWRHASGDECAGCERSGGWCGFNISAAPFGGFLCFCQDAPHGHDCQDEKRNVWKKIALGVGVGGATLIAACFLCFFWFWRKKRRQSSATSNLLGQSASSDLSSIKDTEFGSINCHTHIFSYGELQEATNGFDASRELGDGGFGTVYKGKLRDGRIVAIKRLYENNYKRVEQFMNEVEILSRLRHPNLVNLYGCTSRHSRELLLVYEFVPNGTVADHLHGPQVAKGALSWHVRLRIAIETADALAYLHAAEHQIIHRDVKTNNILLDDNFHVKVADFGLSRLFPIDVTHVSTLPQGTPGYVDPDYHMCYQLTDKSDVYSFGVVLVELISSKPAVDISRQRHEVNLAYMAISMIQNRQLEQLVDPGLGYRTDGETKRMITLVAELAFMCLQGEKEMRPSIKEVLEELRRIQSGGCKAEKGAEADIRTREDVQLLKNSTPFSPDSVMGRWESRLTTPNTSD